MKRHNLLLRKIELIKQNAALSNEKDYRRAMIEIEHSMNLTNIKKRMDRSVKLKREKEKVKLREMSEYRENILKQIAKKVHDKDQLFLTRSQSNKKEHKSILPQLKTLEEKLERVKNEENLFITKTEENISNRLNTISFKHEMALKKIQKNYKNINDKTQEQVDTYNKNYQRFRIEQAKTYKNKKANQIQTYMDLIASNRELQKKRRQNLLKKLSQNKEKKSEIFEENQKKHRELMKRIKNQQSPTNIQRNFGKSPQGKTIENLLKKEQIYSELQQGNIHKLNMMRREKNFDLLEREYEILSWTNDKIRIEEKTRKRIFSETLSNQAEIDRHFTDLRKTLRKLGEENIFNKTIEERMNLFFKMKREEKERKEKEEEEKLRAQGKI